MSIILKYKMNFIGNYVCIENTQVGELGQQYNKSNIIIWLLATNIAKSLIFRKISVYWRIILKFGNHFKRFYKDSRLVR